MFLTISINTLPTPNKKRLLPKPRLLDLKAPKENKRLEYDDKRASGKLIASNEAENKNIDLDDFSSHNSSIMVTSPSSSRFDCEFKNINDVNLFNDTGISTSTDTRKDTCLVPMDFFQATARGCTPFYTSLEGAYAFEAIFEFVNYIYFHVIYISSENVIFS